MEALKSNAVRYKNAQKNCKYFRLNGIKCVIFDAFEGRILSTSNNKTNILNELVANKQLLPDGNLANDLMNDYKINKIACAITKTMVYKELAQKYDNQFKYVLIAEEDAVFSSDFIQKLKSSMHQLPKHRISQNWDIVNLHTKWCRNYHFIQSMGQTLYRYRQIQSFSFGLWTGYAWNTARLIRMDSIKNKIVPNLPIDIYGDLWLGKLIENRKLFAFTFCPRLVEENQNMTSSLDLDKDGIPVPNKNKPCKHWADWDC